MWNLQRDQSVKLGIVRRPDCAEAAAADAFKQLETAQGAGLVQRGFCRGWINHTKRTAASQTKHKTFRLHNGRVGTVAMGAASLSLPLQAGRSAHSFRPTRPTTGFKEPPHAVCHSLGTGGFVHLLYGLLMQGALFQVP